MSINNNQHRKDYPKNISFEESIRQAITESGETVYIATEKIGSVRAMFISKGDVVVTGNRRIPIVDIVGFWTT